MHIKQSIRILLGTAVAALAIAAVAASAASAEVVPAKFSPKEFRLTTTGLTLKRNGIDTKTCVPSPTTLTATGEPGFFYAGNNFPILASKFSCGTGATFEWILKGSAWYDTVANTYTVKINSEGGSSLLSPWSETWFQQNVSNATWVNGSGSTASTMTFTNQVIGNTNSGKQVTVNGTFKATTSSGGLVTISH